MAKKTKNTLYEKNPNNRKNPISLEVPRWPMTTEYERETLGWFARQLATLYLEGE